MPAPMTPMDADEIVALARETAARWAPLLNRKPEELSPREQTALLLADGVNAPDYRLRLAAYASCVVRLDREDLGGEYAQALLSCLGPAEATLMLACAQRFFPDLPPARDRVINLYRQLHGTTRLYRAPTQSWSRREVHLICGLQGSGKTHLRKQIPADLVISFDDEIAKHCLTNEDYQRVWQNGELRARIVMELKRSFLNALARGMTRIVVDMTLLAYEHRVFWREKAAEHGYTVIIHHLRTPLGNCVERVKSRAFPQIPPEVIVKLATRQEPPTEAEGLLLPYA